LPNIQYEFTKYAKLIAIKSKAISNDQYRHLGHRLIT
jgi:hypothetical protein